MSERANIRITATVIMLGLSSLALGGCSKEQHGSWKVAVKCPPAATDIEVTKPRHWEDAADEGLDILVGCSDGYDFRIKNPKALRLESGRGYTEVPKGSVERPNIVDMEDSGGQMKDPTGIITVDYEWKPPSTPDFWSDDGGTPGVDVAPAYDGMSAGLTTDGGPQTITSITVAAP